MFISSLEKIFPVWKRKKEKLIVGTQIISKTPQKM